MAVAQLILFILTAVGFVIAMVLRWACHRRTYATYTEFISLILLVVGTLLYIVNGISGTAGWALLFLFISVLCLTVLRGVSLLAKKL